MHQIRGKLGFDFGEQALVVRNVFTVRAFGKNQPVGFELSESFLHGIGIHFRHHGKLAHGRESTARLIRTRYNGHPKLFDQLQIDWPFVIEFKLYYLHNTMVHIYVAVVKKITNSCFLLLAFVISISLCGYLSANKTRLAGVLLNSVLGSAKGFPFSEGGSVSIQLRVWRVKVILTLKFGR